MSVIETFELTKRYGTRRGSSVLAVDQISLTVEQGQVFGFLGPNGSGKTTTIGMLVGIINPTGGELPPLRRIHTPGTCRRAGTGRRHTGNAELLPLSERP